MGKEERNERMKKSIMKIATLMAVIGILGFTGCGQSEKAKKEVSQSKEAAKEKNKEDKKETEENKVVKEEVTEEKEEVKEENKDRVFGNFTSQDINGNPVDQTVFENYQLTMVNIWGTFCSPCIQEMPELGEISNEYADKMQIIGMIVDVSEPKQSNALKIIDHTKANYLHIITSTDLIEGFLGKVQVVPTTVFVDKDGKQVGDVYTGARNKKEWIKIVDSLLEALPKNEK